MVKRRSVVLLVSIGLIVVAGGAIVVWRWANRAEGSAIESAADEAPPVAAGIVRLTDAKRQAAGIRVTQVRRESFRHMHQVPGRLHYDDTRHVEIKAAADGTIQSCPVKPGDRVERGQVLAVLSSPEIGMARADVLKRQSEWLLAMRQLEWQQQTDKNLQELVSEIQERQTVEEIESQFRGRPLGEYRERLLSAYSRLLLAQSALASVQTAAGTGAVAVRTLRERSSERETAEAALRSACEQIGFDSRLQLSAAEAQVQDAARRRDIARQHLTTLLGYEEQLPAGAAGSGTAQDTRTGGNTVASAATDGGRPGGEADDSSGGKGGATLSLVESRAPFAGTIESKRFAALERVRQGDTLLVLADTTRLWAVADIREQDWPALSLAPDEELKLEFPALPQFSQTARLYYVGREVMPDTNAIPLVATVENADQRLRPGLYVRMWVPIGPPREAQVVPSTALVEHEGTKFVFVAESANEFRRVDVVAGEITDDLVEIKSELPESAQVVTQGAFYLKSELLLEREE